MTKTVIYVHPLDDSKVTMPRSMANEIYEALPEGELAYRLHELLFSEEDEVYQLETELAEISEEKDDLQKDYEQALDNMNHED